MILRYCLTAVRKMKDSGRKIFSIFIFFTRKPIKLLYNIAWLCGGLYDAVSINFVMLHRFQIFSLAAMNANAAVAAKKSSMK
jgi:hypothetical protein